MSKGTYIILDCYGVPPDVCLDDKRLLETAVRAAVAGGATIINTSRYCFGHDSRPYKAASVSEQGNNMSS